MGKIVHGNRNFGYAPINESSGTYSFGTPVMLPGMVSSTVEVDQDSSKIYADDKTWGVIKGAKVRSAEMAFRYIPSAYLEYLGFKKNANGMLTDTGKFPNHCIFFETKDTDDDGTATYTLHYLYCVKGSEPTQEHSTDEDEIEAEEPTISYDASESEFVVDDDGEFVQYAEFTRTEENASVYDTFKTKVILPTDSIK